jgi:hypothetical protein
MEIGMMFSQLHVPTYRPRQSWEADQCRHRPMHIFGCMSASSGRHENAASEQRWLPLAYAVAAMLAMVTAVPASAQTSTTAYAEPAAQSPAKPMSPARTTWMKGRCSQLVAFFDYYGVSRGENSDGPRNHTRIGAALECEQTNFRTGVKTMEALLKRKAFDLPKPGTPEVEPEDIEAPDITRPTSQR